MEFRTHLVKNYGQLLNLRGIRKQIISSTVGFYNKVRKRLFVLKIIQKTTLHDIEDFLLNVIIVAAVLMVAELKTQC